MVMAAAGAALSDRREITVATTTAPRMMMSIPMITLAALIMPRLRTIAEGSSVAASGV